MSCLSDLTRHDWVALCEAGQNVQPAWHCDDSLGHGVLPDQSALLGVCVRVVQSRKGRVCRASGLLMARCRSGSPPVLFHKPTLQGAEDAVLAADVRKEIASPHRKIVGVVINAVDDNLLKGEQIDMRWSRDAIKVLPSLLHEARKARRRGGPGKRPWPCAGLPDAGAARRRRRAVANRDRGARLPTSWWSRASGSLAEGHRLIAPWSERVRYGMKKNGYHGGLTPQEMVIPIAVLTSTERSALGGSELPVDTPAWWEETGARPRHPSSSRPRHSSPPRRRHGHAVRSRTRGRDGDRDSRPQPASPCRSGSADWSARPSSASRSSLQAAECQTMICSSGLLGSLDQRGGKMTSVALARVAAVPASAAAGPAGQGAARSEHRRLSCPEP